MKILCLTMAMVFLLMMFPFVASSIDDKALVLYLPFDEGSGTVAKDYSGAGNDGVLKGATKWTDGKVGKAVSFHNDDGCVEVEKYIALDNRPFTVEAWIYRFKDQKETWDATLTQIESLSASKGLHFGVRRDTDNPSGCATFAFYSNDANSTVGIAKEEWYHLAGVYTGKKQQLFINGKLDTERDAAAYGGIKGNIFIGIRPEMEGAAPGTHGLQFDGIIDEVAIYQKALSDAEIKQDMGTAVKLLAVFPAGKLATTWGDMKKAK